MLVSRFVEYSGIPSIPSPRVVILVLSGDCLWAFPDKRFAPSCPNSGHVWKLFWANCAPPDHYLAFDGPIPDSLSITLLLSPFPLPIPDSCIPVLYPSLLPIPNSCIPALYPSPLPPLFSQFLIPVFLSSPPLLSQFLIPVFLSSTPTIPINDVSMFRWF